MRGARVPVAGAARARRTATSDCRVRPGEAWNRLTIPPSRRTEGRPRRRSPCACRAQASGNGLRRSFGEAPGDRRQAHTHHRKRKSHHNLSEGFRAGPHNHGDNKKPRAWAPRHRDRGWEGSRSWRRAHGERSTPRVRASSQRWQPRRGCCLLPDACGNSRPVGKCIQRKEQGQLRAVGGGEPYPRRRALQLGVPEAVFEQQPVDKDVTPPELIQGVQVRQVRLRIRLLGS